MREGSRGKSAAHPGFCVRSLGLDASLHCLPHAEQLDLVVQALTRVQARRVLDLGCGVGLVSELIAERTGAHVLGLDPAPAAVARATARTSAKAERLAFEVADLDDLDLVPGAFDAVVAIDSLCCVRDLVDVVDRLRTALVPGGRLVALATHGWDARTPRETFDVGSLAPGRTPLGLALQANALPFTARDLTVDDAGLHRRYLYQVRVP